jgi:hypothetical protein
LSPQYEPHHKGRFDKNQPAGGMQNAKSPPKGSGGQTSQYEFRAHLYTQQETNVNAQVALRRLLGTRLGGISEKTLAAGLGPGKEIDVDISAASRSPSPPCLQSATTVLDYRPNIHVTGKWPMASQIRIP